MPAITRSRLEEIRTLATAVGDGMTRRVDASLTDRVAQLKAAVDEVNASLREVDELLGAGLRAEALSMHDPELVTVARLLDVRSNPNWIRLHGWLLERGQAPPAAVNVEAAEQLAAAADDPGLFREDLARLRRLALERAPLPARLEIVRRLWEADPSGRAWLEAVDAHEEARLRELRLAVPRAREAADFRSLAAMADELADSRWGRQPPSDLLPLTAGAADAAELAHAVAEAEALAAETGALMAGDAPATPREIDELSARRERLAELERHADGILEALALHPDMLRLVRRRGLDTATRRATATVATALERIHRLAAVLKTRRDFEAACRQIEHLCDHPPLPGQESRWTADLQRCDTVARAACQEIPDLAMPPLLRERAQRAALVVESREQLRRRFWVITAAASVAGLLAVTAVIGWFVMIRGERAGAIEELERRVAEARAGGHLERPDSVDTVVDRYAGDPRVDSLAEEFDAAVAAEKKRAADFQQKLADVGERLDDLGAAADDRRAAGEQGWLEAWPPSFVAAATALATARGIGGLPEKRGKASDDVALPAEARRRLQAEEDDLARAEARQADLDRSLSGLAREAFSVRLGRIQDRMADAADADESRKLLGELRALRREAEAPKADGLPAAAAGQRVPATEVATLEALEQKLGTMGRQSGGGRNGGSR